jgi:hypothetical protein
MKSGLLIMFYAGIAFGQWNAISTVGEGHKIRVETAANKYKGTFSSSSDTAVKLISREGEVSVPREEVLRVYSQSKSHRTLNTVIGTGIGVAIGVVLYATIGALLRNESGSETAPLLVLPMAGGAALGAALPTGRMVKIYDCRCRSSQARPNAQSRFKVATETPSASAISVSVSPAKNRNSMTRAARASNCSSLLSASSNSSRSCSRYCATPLT